MAPKSPSKSLSTADNSDNNIDKDKPLWDTSQITKPGYLVMLCRWLPAQDENHRLLVERGVTMHRERTVVVSWGLLVEYWLAGTLTLRAGV